MTDRQQLMDRIDDRRRAHQPSASLHRKLVQQTTAELAEIERVERIVAGLGFAVDSVIEAFNDSPAYVLKNVNEIEQAFARLQFLRSAMQIKPLVAAEGVT